MAEPTLQEMTVLYGEMALELARRSPDFEKKMRSLVATNIKQVALFNSMEADTDGCLDGHVRCPDGSCMPAEMGCVSLRSLLEPAQ